MFKKVFSLWWPDEQILSEPGVSGLEGSCRLLGYPGAVAWPVLVRDLSVDSARLMLHRRIEAETLLVLDLDGAFPRRLIAQVSQCTPQAGGWLAVCDLVERLCEEELLQLA